MSETLNISGDIASPVAGEWLSYDISDLSEGRYILKINAQTDNQAFLNIAVNGEAAASVNLVCCEEYVDNFAYMDIRPFATIPNANNRLKITCAFGSLNVASIYLKKYQVLMKMKQVSHQHLIQQSSVEESERIVNQLE